MVLKIKFTVRRPIYVIYAVQRQINNGKCGVCGNTFFDEKSRLIELSISVVAIYSLGQVIDVKIDLTANNKVFF
jgi:hypothetical protein